MDVYRPSAAIPLRVVGLVLRKVAEDWMLRVGIHVVSDPKIGELYRRMARAEPRYGPVPAWFW